MNATVFSSAVPLTCGLVGLSYRASSARLSNYLLGGKDHYECDQHLATRLLEVAPWLDRAEHLNRRFARYATSLAANRGVGQFLDLGCGLPRTPSLHETAAAVRPGGVRVVYVDHDPHVVAHARALMVPGPPSAAAHLQADLLDLETVLKSPEVDGFLDLDRPVGVSLHAVLHLIPDDGAVRSVLELLKDWMPAGSHLSLTHPTGDFQPDTFRRIGALYGAAGLPLRPRSRREVAALFDGLELLSPGVTATARQLRTRRVARLPPWCSAAYAGIAIKL